MKDPQDKRVQIGMLTLGQSPRTDVISDIGDILGSNVEIIECGALDGLSLEEIKKLEPSLNEHVLVTRLKDGTEVKVSHEKIISRLNQCLQKLEKRSKILFILCTSTFPIYSQKLLIKPSKLIKSVVQNLLPKGQLGVLIPTPEQAQVIESKWNREGISLKIEVLSPYQDTKTEIVQEVATSFKDASVDLIVLDCMGYTKRIGGLIHTMTGIPVIVSKTLVARIVRELI
ncbi:MAG: AroM family protein [Candidatus Heimdallarchaeota archaeon]